jgi:hypothetical protein
MFQYFRMGARHILFPMLLEQAHTKIVFSILGSGPDTFWYILHNINFLEFLTINHFLLIQRHEYKAAMCSARNYTTHWHTRPGKKTKLFGFDRQSAKHVRARQCSTAPLRPSLLAETLLFVPPLSAVYLSVKYRPSTDAV